MSGLPGRDCCRGDSAGVLRAVAAGLPGWWVVSGCPDRGYRRAGFAGVVRTGCRARRGLAREGCRRAGSVGVVCADRRGMSGLVREGCRRAGFAGVVRADRRDMSGLAHEGSCRASSAGAVRAVAADCRVLRHGRLSGGGPLPGRSRGRFADCRGRSPGQCGVSGCPGRGRRCADSAGWCAASGSVGVLRAIAADCRGWWVVSGSAGRHPCRAGSVGVVRANRRGTSGLVPEDCCEARSAVPADCRRAEG